MNGRAGRARATYAMFYWLVEPAQHIHMSMPTTEKAPPSHLRPAITGASRLNFTVGGGIQLGALVAASVLTVRSRRQAAFRLNLCGVAALALSLLLWATVVAPVNAEWKEVIDLQSEPLADAYSRLRNRWEYGHVVAMIAWLAGYVALLWSALYRRESG